MRRIELGFEIDGREKGTHKEHRHKFPIKETNFIPTTSVIVLQLFLLYGEGKDRVRVKRCVEGSYTYLLVVTASFPGLLHVSSMLQYL